MENIQLTNELYMKKMEPDNKKDSWLIEELKKDEQVSGENGYLGPMTDVFKNLDYLKHAELWRSSFSIYHRGSPIGYLEISPVFELYRETTVDFSYALVKQARGKGYMTSVLKKVSDMVFMDQVAYVQTIYLMIDPDNIPSQKVALHAGFTKDDLSEEEHRDQGFILYKKIRK